MASPASASTSAPVSLSLPLSPSPYRLLRAPNTRVPTRRLSLAPSRPRATALLSSLNDTQEKEEELVEEVEEEEEDIVEEDGFVEVGYVSGVHGVRGDVLVAPRTDFPDLRFATPGKRWLRARAAGKMQIREFELVRGKSHTGKKGWIVNFYGVNTLDEARQLVGSAILVKSEDRPEMEEDEIYSLDLVGMRVIVKDTGKLVGTVSEVFNFGGGDLLQVMVGSAENPVENQESTSSGEHVWIPFAEEIVPDIDMENREMWIKPPKGLLEINLRSDKRPKKERRAMEWKEKKKLQRRVIAAKKMLSEMDQGHILEGLLSGDKVQKASLAEQIGCIDLQLFQHAMHSVSKQIVSSSKGVLAKFSSSRKKVMRIPYETLVNHGEKEKHVFSNEFKKGLEILQSSKAATVLVTSGSDSDVVDSEFQRLLISFSELMKVEQQCFSLPFVIVTSAAHVDSVRSCLVENDYFGLDTQKVWVLEELQLPIVSISSETASKKVLLKSPWEIIQRPAGSGAIFTLLSSNKILEALNKMGVEYLQICSLSDGLDLGHPLLFGAVSSRGVDAGIKLCKAEDDFNLILSMNHVNRFCRDVTKVSFSALPEQHTHVEGDDGQWVTVQPNAANSHRLHTDVTSVLSHFSSDKVCVMEIVQ